MNVISFQDDYLGIFTRSYLLQTEHYNVFVDGGLLSGKDAKLPYLTDGRKNVLILTHGHWDHIGCSSLTLSHGGEVYVHEGDLPHVTDYQWLWKMLFGQFKNDFDLPAAREPLFWSCVGEEFKPSRTLQDGEVLQFDDLRLQVIATPGHSPGSICLLDEGSGTLFSGDSIIGNGFFGGTAQIADIRAYIASMEKLKAFHPSCVMTAHTPVMEKEQFLGWLDDSIACAQRAESAVRKYVKQSDVLTVGAAAQAIAEAEGKKVGGGTCVTALAGLKCFEGDSRAQALLDTYIYGY